MERSKPNIEVWAGDDGAVCREEVECSDGGLRRLHTFLHAFPPFYPIVLFLYLSVCLNPVLFCDQLRAATFASQSPTKARLLPRMPKLARSRTQF